MDSRELLSLQYFLSNFSELESSLSKLKIDADLTAHRRFLNSFSQVTAVAEKLIENIAPQFNLFEILNLSYYEAWVHTPFLTHLLSPSGSHGQGRLFFDAFMAHIIGVDYIPNVITSITLHPEYHTAYGNIDLLIKYKDSGVSKAIVLENKITAGDQEMQMERYYNYLRDIMLLADRNLLMLYLKPRAGRPSAYSISDNLYYRLKSQNILREIDYNVDMTCIFESILHLIKAPVVRETVSQYIQTIKTL